MRSFETSAINDPDIQRSNVEEQNHVVCSVALKYKINLTSNRPYHVMIFCFVTSYSLVDGLKLFGEKYCFHVTVKKEENVLAETSNTYHKKNRDHASENLSKHITKTCV
jgi:hypothetical protein